MSRTLCLASLMLCGLGLSACAGPVETHAGFAGSNIGEFGVGAGTSITVVESPASGNLAAAASAAIMTALAKRGQSITVDSPRRLTVSLSERPSYMAINADDGTPLSAAKRQRLLQNCADRTQRLLIVLEGQDKSPVRAWAEESHCRGQLEASLPALAEQAVAALYRQSGSVTLRSGQD